jgi:hypothetical protein
MDADIKRQIRREQFLSEEDLDLVNLSWEELIEYWNLWLEQAQISNDLDKDEYSHGVFCSPKETERLLKKYGK